MKRLLFCWAGIALAWGAPHLFAQTLGEALDAPHLVWTSGGATNWLYQTNTTFDGVDAAVSGQIGDNQQVWMETTVVGPGTVSFWWNVSSELNWDWLEFYISGVRQARLSGDLRTWSYRVFDVPAGTNTLRWRYVKDPQLTGGTLDRAWVDQVKFIPGTPPSLATVLDICGYTWTSGGNTNPTYWTGQTNVTYDGVDAAESGAVYGTVSSPQESWMETTVSGATNVSFWWKVSSRTNDTWLEFYIGTARQARISGEVNWQFRSFAVPPGSQTLRWRYIKTNSIPVGADRGWVDLVTILPAQYTAPSITAHPQPQVVIPGGTAAFSVTATGTTPLAYQWLKNSLALADATNATLNLTNVQLADAGNYSVLVTNLCGAVTSQVAALTVELPPTLRAALQGDALLLSWPLPALPYQLQQIGAFGETWQNVSQPPTTNAGEVSVSVPMSPTNQFFRLRSQ